MRGIEDLNERTVPRMRLRSHARRLSLLAATLAAGAASGLALSAPPASAASTSTAVNGSIEGTVTEAGTGEVIEGIEACPLALEEVVEGYEAYVLAGNCATTNIRGEYEINALPEKEYVVGFLAPEPLNYLTTYYDEKTTDGTTNPLDATEVQVKGGVATPSIDVAMAKGGIVKGTVRSAATGAPVAGVEVCALEQVSPEEVYEAECAQSKPGGGYVLERVAGEYELAFYPGGGYIEPQFYENVLSFSEASPVKVESGKEVSLSPMELQVGGNIAGTVTNASIEKEPVPGMLVCAEQTTEEAFECAFTRGNGEYTIPGLRSGSYWVEFTGADCEATSCAESFKAELYNGVTSYLSATLVNVTAPQATSGIDASMLEASPVKPTNLDPPALSGLAAVGHTLSCSQGAWSGNPTSIAYAWLRNGTPIAGQAGTSYAVQSGDAEQQLSCEVTVGNAAGSASTPSVAVVIPPYNHSVPPPHNVRGVVRLSGKPKERSGAAILALSCVGETECKGRLKLVAKTKTKTAKRVRRDGKLVVERVAVSETVGSAKFKLAAGGRERIPVHLNAKGAALLRKNGSLKLQLAGSDVQRTQFSLSSSGSSKRHGIRAALRRSFAAAPPAPRRSFAAAPPALRRSFAAAPPALRRFFAARRWGRVSSLIRARARRLALR